jgi:hypothetical protein
MSSSEPSASPMHFDFGVRLGIFLMVESARYVETIPCVRIIMNLDTFSLSAIAASVLLGYIAVCILLYSFAGFLFAHFTDSIGQSENIKNKLHCANGLCRLNWTLKTSNRMPVIQVFSYVL